MRRLGEPDRPLFQSKYFDHVTIEPVFENNLEELKALIEETGFRVASLLMKKREEDTETRSQYDTFMTNHYETKEDAANGIRWVASILKENRYKIWRYKIEDVIMDSRGDDVLELL